ncbi:putative subunit of the anaphase promoting complex [Auricularia subglabra TFB-10046 SS5]|nr:putative subunit of the anaphase promoting complex [Auricularia subglabra TFB-10046 SS5]
MLEGVRDELRTISKTPYRVLDAPELADDFYLSELSWSHTNVLAVGLGSCVYLWHADSADVHKLCDYSATDSVSSVSWHPQSSRIAVGTQSGLVHLWDASTKKLVHTWSDHTERVGTLAWEKDYFASGSRDRNIMLNDIRSSEAGPSMRFSAHRQEVCGLAYNNVTGLLASGGNDNKVMVWDVRKARQDGLGSTAPLFKFHEHTAAVKALAWSPHMPNILATGGGTQDKYLRFWNMQRGRIQEQYDTGSQVCALLWSKSTNELVSSHGFSATAAQNQILVFRYPKLSMVASLQGHTSRVLYLAMSPDGATIVSGAGDETLRFWTVFPQIKNASGNKKASSAITPHGQMR